MLFTTLGFLIFFVVAYLAYWSVPNRQRVLLIVVSSIAFYAVWSIGFAFHFVGIVILNYLFVRSLHRKKSARVLAMALVLNTANLFLFKYFYLFLQALHDLSGAALFQKQAFDGWIEGLLGANSIVLPLAISFYTFQLIAYVVDVYRGGIEKQVGLPEFMAFIMFFPQLIAGPIMRHSDFFHQLAGIKPDEKRMRAGLFLLLLGIIKKVIIADNILPRIAAVYARPDDYDWFSNLNAASGFVLCIYCDFSGYTDMARGLSKLLGLELPENFRGPYLAASLREFWQRWHITLSTWMRDYLYIPLGGSKTTAVRMNIITMITMVLAGLWHGASYKFLVWGMMHGAALVLERQIRRVKNHFFPPPPRRSPDAGPLPEPSRGSVLQSAAKRAVMVVLTYFVTVLIAVPFFAPSLTETWQMLAQILTLGGGVSSAHNDFLGGMLVVNLLLNYLQTVTSWPDLKRPAAYALLIAFGMFTIFLLGSYSPDGQEFIYFQF